MFNVQSEQKSDVEAIMYLETEMPCRQGQTLSGKIVVRNNGNEDIQLLKSAVNPDNLVRSQICLFTNFSEQERKSFSDAHAAHVGLDARDPPRDIVKLNVDYEIENNHTGYFITLKKGEAFELKFEGRMMQIPFLLLGGGNRRVPIGAELYLSPDKWVPVEVHPPISVACYVKPIGITRAARYNADEPWVYRINIGTNSSLYMALDRTRYDLADLNLDDVVTHTNKTITITQKDGKARVITEADIPRISAERTEAKRKARELEFQKLLKEKGAQ